MTMKPFIYRLNEVTSTNSYLQEWIKAGGVPEKTIVFARSQTHGKGQMGNKWSSDAGMNLTFSIVVYPRFILANEQFILSQVTALAVKETIERYVDDVHIKWPNDIYCDNRKITGILIENNLEGKIIASSVLGIGINVNQKFFSEDLINPVSLYQLTGKEYDIEEMLNFFYQRFSYYYDYISTPRNVEEIRTRYFASLYRGTGIHSFFDKKKMETIRASIHSVTSSGILVLETDQRELRSYFFKEVEYLLG